MLWLKDQAPHASPRGAFSEVDPHEYGGLRQGNIALIHSAPTGERFPPMEPSFRDGALAPDLRYAIAYRGISRFRVRCCASPRNDGVRSIASPLVENLNARYG